jgi:hypothetical protein
MIDDMTLLKQAMEQMDAEDPAVAQAAKDRAAQTLGEAQLSFSKMAELIEQRRLLLRPRIVTNIRRMDQPGMLGDAAFRDTGSALRKDGQSFRQIAEAIERTGRLGPRYEESVQTSEPPERVAIEPLYQMPVGPDEPRWPRALFFVARIVFFPLRHPIRFLAIVLLAAWLFSAFGGVSPRQHAPNYAGGVDTIRHGADQAMSWLSTFFHERILRQSKEATAQPTPPAPIPSPSAAASSLPTASPSAAPAIGPAPPTTPAPSNATAPPAPSSAVPAPSSAVPAPSSAAPVGPPVSTPRRAARNGPASKWAMDCDPPEDRYSMSRRQAPPEDKRPFAFEDLIPEGIPRNSRVAGPCVGGVGGCSWGGY